MKESSAQEEAKYNSKKWLGRLRKESKKYFWISTSGVLCYYI
jgi:hypothetical protein